jgi:hypothetical protein
LKKKSALFSLEDAKHFYMNTEKLPKEVRRAWFLFAHRFLPCVNSDWLRSLSGTKVKSRVNMFQFISVSDEAFVRWVLEVKYKRIKEEIDNGYEIDSKFVKPKGAHDSNRYLSRYNEIHAEVKAGRSKENQVIYNNWFWTYFKLHYKILFQDNSKISIEDIAASKHVALAGIDDIVPSSAKTTTYEVDENELESETKENCENGINNNPEVIATSQNDEDEQEIVKATKIEV